MQGLAYVQLPLLGPCQYALRAYLCRHKGTIFLLVPDKIALLVRPVACFETGWSVCAENSSDIGASKLDVSGVISSETTFGDGRVVAKDFQGDWPGPCS